MSSHAAPRRENRSRWPRSARLRAALSLGVILGIGSVSTFAHWTDQVTVTGTTFTAGSIDLKVNDSNAVTGYTSLNIANMVPGNTTAGILTINNTGTAPLKYQAAAVATNADGKNLAAALTVRITAATAVTGTSPSATCAGTALPGTGTALNSSLITTGRLLGPNTTPGVGEKLCIEVMLPASANTSLQGATTTVTFTFTGTSDLT